MSLGQSASCRSFRQQRGPAHRRRLQRRRSALRSPSFLPSHPHPRPFPFSPRLTMADHPEHQPSVGLNLSDDDGSGPGEPGPSNKPANTKRGTRACDRCRKIKSKCEPGAGEKCKNCEVANTPCTFQGPSFKRGPPKGYIHSIEQRWHQVECILATIMEAPQAQDIIQNIRADPFANAILDRVKAGPYGPRNRMEQSMDTSSEGFYASLMEVPEHTAPKDDRRSRRHEDPTALSTPTKEWQEQLSRRLAYGNQWPYAPASLSPVSGSSSSVGGTTETTRTRRRVDYPGQPANVPPTPQGWDNLYTLPDQPGELPVSSSSVDANAHTAGEPNTVDETAESFGHLSVDENKEFRYHGPASGLPLLAQSRRKTGDDLQENRIWKFSAAHIDPEIADQDPTAEEEEVEVRMPSPEMQYHLLQLYFTYVHPFFPVVHKQDFLYHYNSLYVLPYFFMLLLSMFAIAARYSNRPEDHPGSSGTNVSRAGQQYAEDAHKLLDRKYQTSRPSTCQALLLLAIREFGMGAMDKGWLYSGTSSAIAIDLGMNRNADGWTTDGTTPVFSDSEKQIRKHIWWSCCICDKLSAVWLGRPITFRANDYSTPVPGSDEVDEGELWEPYPRSSLGPDFVPQTSRLMTSFQEACHLSVIITDIMDKIYPVQPSSETPRRVLFEQLETRLNKWLIDLPEHLRFSANDKHAHTLPHILMLHIEYQAALLLLHRAFLPSYSEDTTQPLAQSDPLALKAFDVCSGAAVQITTMSAIFHDRFGLEKAPPFLSIYLQSAGIMHVITLTRRPWDPQATLGLTRCISACKQMEAGLAHSAKKLWPTATRLRLLLEGAKVRLDESAYAYSQTSRPKRSVDDALGESQTTDFSARDMYGQPAVDQYHHASPTASRAWDYGQHSRTVEQTLGVGFSGNEASTSSYPGFQWWPSQLMTTQGLTHMSLSAPMDMPPVSAPMPYGSMPGLASMPSHPQQQTPHHMHQQHTQGQHVPQQHQQGLPQEQFTFGQGSMSQEFVQGVNYPAYDYRYHQGENPGPS
ncbi:fungal-specific transcription factor domain-containing protein [Trametes elegans]|nr:fungal-specific transcription factor domain-containing protein [Trametes elegans]